MSKHLLAIDDVEEDFEMILKWAIEFKRLWKEGDDVAVNFLPLDTISSRFYLRKTQHENQSIF